MMRSLCIAILLLFATTASAIDSTEPLKKYYQTPTELYEQCQSAIELAEAERWQEFYDNACVIRFSTAIVSIAVTTHYLDIGPKDEKQKHEMDLIKRQQERFCALQSTNTHEPPELQLAKNYIHWYDAKKTENPFKHNLNKPSSSAFLIALEHCTVN